jgi:hypothetical protein
MTHLRKKMLEELERRNYAQRTYLRAVTEFSSMRWPQSPAVECSKDTKRTQSVERGSGRSCQVIEKMVSAVGIEPTTY